MKNFEKGIEKVEKHFEFKLEFSIKYDIKQEMKDVSDEEWIKICTAINRRQYKPRVWDFIQIKNEIAKPVYHDDGKNYPVRCTKCDHMVAVKFAPGIAKNYVCGHCIEEENVPF